MSFIHNNPPSPVNLPITLHEHQTLLREGSGATLLCIVLPVGFVARGLRCAEHGALLVVLASVLRKLLTTLIYHTSQHHNSLSVTSNLYI